MIGLLMMLATATSPLVASSNVVENDTLFCALAGSKVKRDSLLELHDAASRDSGKSDSWEIWVGNYRAAAISRQESNGSINHLLWLDRQGQPISADFAWSDSWGPTGVAATVKLARKDGSHSVSGRCYIDPKIAVEDVGT